MGYDVIREGNLLKVLKDGEVVEELDLSLYSDLRKWTKRKYYWKYGTYEEGLTPIVDKDRKRIVFIREENRKVWKKAVSLISDYLKELKKQGRIPTVSEENKKLWKEILKLSKEFVVCWETPTYVGELKSMCFESRIFGFTFSCINPLSPKKDLERVLEGMKKALKKTKDKQERTEILWDLTAPENEKEAIDLAYYYNCMKGD